MSREAPEWADITGWVDLDLRDDERPPKNKRNIKRATAEKNLAEMVERMGTVNAEIEFLYEVQYAIVFGSFLSEEPTINDVDVGVHLVTKYPDIPPQVMKRIEQEVAYLEKDYGSSLEGELDSWWHHYRKAVKFIKNRKGANSVMLIDEMTPLLGHINYKVIFGEQEVADKDIEDKAQEYSKYKVDSGQEETGFFDDV